MRLIPVLIGLVTCQEDVQVSCDPDVMEIRITKGKIYKKNNIAHCANFEFSKSNRNL